MAGTDLCFESPSAVKEEVVVVSTSWIPSLVWGRGMVIVTVVMFFVLSGSDFSGCVGVAAQDGLVVVVDASRIECPNKNH